LGKVIAATRVVVANENERGTPYAAEAVGCLPVVPGNDQVNVCGQLSVGGPNESKKRLDLIGIFLAVVVREEGAGIAVFFPQSLFKTLLHQSYHEPVRQAGDAIWTRPDRLTGTARCHDQAFYFSGKIERQFQGDASTHGMTDEVRCLDAEVVQ